jgi:DNA-binding NarL/FixJ family response regulator
METHTFMRHIGDDGILKVELPVGVRNTTVEVVIVVQPIIQSISRMQRAKQQYARAYQPWTSGEEQEMMQMYRAGLKAKAIAEKLQRQPGAIRSRIEKLQGRPYPEQLDD